MHFIFPVTPLDGFSAALLSGQNLATMIDFVFPPHRIHFAQTQQVVHQPVIRTSLLLNGGTSAQLPAVNWLVQAVTRGGGSCTDQICFILKAYSLSGKTRNYPVSQSQIRPWLNAPVVNPDTMSKERYSHMVSCFKAAKQKIQDDCIKFFV